MNYGSTLAEIKVIPMPEALPPDRAVVLRNVILHLVGKGGPNVVTVALTGDVARGRYDAEHGLIDLLVILRSDGLSHLDVVAAALGTAKGLRVAPFVLTETEYLRSADAFPVRWLDIQRHHVLLHGERLPEVEVERELIRIRAEQSAKGHVLRLRQAYLERSSDRRALWGAVTASLSKLSVTLGAVLDLVGQEVPGRRNEVFVAAARALEIDGSLLERLDNLVLEHRYPTEDDFRPLFESYLALLGKVSEKVDGLV